MTVTCTTDLVVHYENITDLVIQLTYCTWHFLHLGPLNILASVRIISRIQRIQTLPWFPFDLHPRFKPSLLEKRGDFCSIKAYIYYIYIYRQICRENFDFAPSLNSCYATDQNLIIAAAAGSAMRNILARTRGINLKKMYEQIIFQ